MKGITQQSSQIVKCFHHNLVMQKNTYLYVRLFKYKNTYMWNCQRPGYAQLIRASHLNHVGSAGKIKSHVVSFYSKVDVCPVFLNTFTSDNWSHHLQQRITGIRLQTKPTKPFVHDVSNTQFDQLVSSCIELIWWVLAVLQPYNCILPTDNGAHMQQIYTTNPDFCGWS